MTKWKLKCDRCGGIQVRDLGFNLYEFKKVHIYCPYCRENTPHTVLGHE
ncbi:hypothetical protein [Thermofilum pendens]|nr:hypothetical protein [Thermofilum pendens]